MEEHNWKFYVRESDGSLNEIPKPDNWNTYIIPYSLDALVIHKNGGIYRVKRRWEDGGNCFYQLTLETNTTMKFLEGYIEKASHFEIAGEIVGL